VENCHFPVLLPLDLQATNRNKQGGGVDVLLHLPLVVAKDFWKRSFVVFLGPRKGSIFRKEVKGRKYCKQKSIYVRKGDERNGSFTSKIYLPSKYAMAE
jgi:hypothetical protein